MFLEKWIYDKIDTGKDGITRKDLEEYQLSRLKRTLDFVYEKSTFYQRLFDKAGIKPDDIQALRDLRNLPFTNSSDLAESPYTFLCVSLADVERIYTLSTGGTTGPPKKIFFTEKDISSIIEYMGAAFTTVAILGGIGSSGYKTALFLPDTGPAGQAGLLARGVEKNGGTAFKMDISLSYQEHLELIKEIKPDILFGSVTRFWRFTQELGQTNKLSEIGVKVVFTTSEYMPQAMKDRIRDAWGCDVYHHYGMTEMGFGGPVECNAHNGFHANEAEFLFEIVDPVTGHTVNAGDEGELVFTTLNREGMPLIRYRTGDLTRLITEPCECGTLTLHRIDRIEKRIVSIVKLESGDGIYPSMFADVICTVPGVIDYETVLSRDGNVDCLILTVEMAGEDAGILEKVIDKVSQIPVIRENIKTGVVTVKTTPAKPGELRRLGRAKKTIVDRR